MELTVKFGGSPNEVNVRTFLKSLAGISTAIDEINAEIGNGQHLEVNIKAKSKGSFLLHLGLAPSAVADFFKSVDWDTTYKIIASLVGLFTLRQMLKGKKPEKIEERGKDITVTTQSGNVFNIDKVTFNIYNGNAKVSEAISQTFESLSIDPSIESFELQDENNKTIFGVSKNEFGEMAVRGKLEIPEEKARQLEELATIYIFKLVWDPGRKWEFLYKGNKISAFIRDDSFFSSIDSGEKFSKGDCLEVELQIRQELDESVNVFVNKEYYVTKVLKHVRRSEQGNLPL